MRWPSSSFAPVVCALVVAASCGANAAPPPFTLTPTGPPVNIWASVDTLHRCGFIDVPDIPARPFVDAAGTAHMIVGSTTFRRMEGQSLFSLNRSCVASYNSTNSPDPAMFAGDEFLDSPIAFDNGTVVALVHTEYPGNVYKNCTGPAYPHCWTVSIGLAVSHDFGATWAHAAPPPAHLVAAVPYGYNQSQLAYGWGDPSNIVAGRGDGFFYAAVWNRNQVGLQAPGVCMMRTASLLSPASWRAWDGAAYTVPFASPYTMAPGTEAAHVCAVTNLPGCPLGGLAWSTALNLYVATMDCSLQGGEQFYVTSSPDLITWADPQPFYNAKMLPANVSKLITAMTYPTLVDPDAGDKNFGTVGTHPWLFWGSIGHSPYSDGRHLWATAMKFA